MRPNRTEDLQGEDLFVGIDLHKRTWHITIRTTQIEVFSASIAGQWKVLSKLLGRYKSANIHAVYEAGFFGFWLFDKLMETGVDCIWGSTVIGIFLLPNPRNQLIFFPADGSRAPKL
jgi:transposase